LRILVARQASRKKAQKAQKDMKDKEGFGVVSGK
jgi:hypothetical protein